MKLRITIKTILFNVVFVSPIFWCNALYAQNAKDYEFPLSENKIANSKYNRIMCLDSRTDTTGMGEVQTGFFNKRNKVVSKKPLSVQLDNVFRSLIDEDAKNGELLLQVRDFGFAEITRGMSETGYCFARADLYAKVNGGYAKIITIDTVVTLRSGIDVTAGILSAGAEVVKEFIAKSLLKEPLPTEYLSYNNIVNINDFEKRKLKLYNTDTYAEGLYTNYQSFKNQVPDKQIVVEGKYLYDGLITTTDDKGKVQKVKGNKIYAIVFNGQPYIASKDGYYPLKKVNDEFIFTGKAIVSSGTGEMVAASLFGGVLGGLIIGNPEGTFEMKVDHVNGGFIKLKEIPQNSQQQD